MMRLSKDKSGAGDVEHGATAPHAARPPRQPRRDASPRDPRRTPFIALLLATCAVACGPQSFQPHFEPPEARAERMLLSQITHAHARNESPAFVGISSDATRLWSWDVERGVLWEQAVQAKSAPLLAGDAIVLQEQDGVVVRNLSDGQRRALVDERGRLVGADGAGERLVIAVAYEGAGPRGAVWMLEGARARWSAPLTMPVGVPALVGDHVLVPWATQRLSALSVVDGTELTRWHFNNTVLGHAQVVGDHVLVGQLGWSRLDERVLEASPEPPQVFTPFKRSLPVQSPLLRDGYVPIAEPNNAQHRLALDWQVMADAQGTLAVRNDVLLWRFYRLLFALSASGDALRWVRAFDADLVGVAVVDGGAWIADAAGTLRFVDNAGRTTFERGLGREVSVMAMRAVAAPVWPASAPLPADVPLRDQLYAAAALDDDRLGAARGYAVEQLARMVDEPVLTLQLIALCENRRAPPQVPLAACAALGERRAGGEHVVDALRRRASFLDGTSAPPIGPLAKAAIGMQLAAAGPLLAAHAEDPNTTAEDLVVLFDALSALKHRPAAGPIERFVRLHHAEPAGSELIPALQAATRTLAALRVLSAKQTLQETAEDALTAAPLRESASEALASLSAPRPSETPEPEPTPTPEPETPEVITDPRPYAITAEMLFKALTPVRRPLGLCLAADPARPFQARLSMVVDGDGKPEGIFVVPTTLQDCIEPLIRSVQFPATRAGRQRLTHIIRGASAVPAPPAPKSKPKRVVAPPAANAPTANAPATPAAVTP